MDIIFKNALFAELLIFLVGFWGGCLLGDSKNIFLKMLIAVSVIAMIAVLFGLITVGVL